MKIELSKDGQVCREVVWLTAWCMVATASNCTDKNAATAWADTCLHEFDKRFPSPSEGANDG